jgi:predicted amidohydrolase
MPMLHRQSASRQVPRTQCRRTLRSLEVLLTLLACFPLTATAQLDRAITVGVYQGPCLDGDFPANLASARRVVATALQRGCDFLTFPEAFLSGYATPETVRRGARSLQDPDLQAFVLESARHEMVIVVGLARREGEQLYNSALVLHQGRLLGAYDKVMLTTGDRQSLGFAPGTAVPVFLAHGVRFAVAICHDTSFPHVATAARFQGAQLLLTPHYNRIAPSVADDHRRWVRNCHVGLASQLKMAVARANTVATDPSDLLGYGDSFILGPQGEPLAQTDLFKTELLTAKVTPEMFEPPTVWGDLHETPAWLRQQVADLMTEFRLPTSEADLRRWLENMVVYHRFAPHEISAATGLTPRDVQTSIERLGLSGRKPALPQAHEPLRVLPYPGGRHPRIAFLDGALMPQRDTKISVFSPWNPTHYVVVDLPEAIWSNLGLTYLAHTHIPTIWSAQNVSLPRLEWQVEPGGTLRCARSLPNGIEFGAQVAPTPNELHMRLWLRNGTDQPLSDLRVQICAHLKGAPDFNSQTLTNKLFAPPFAATRSEADDRWIITAWTPIDRCWGNADVPCMHADPRFPDCAPGDTVEIRGWLSFFAGADVHAEFGRIRRTGFLPIAAARSADPSTDP